MSTHVARRSGPVLLALASALVGAPIAAADDGVRARDDVTVTITDLGFLGGGTQATQITDSGVVIGFSWTATGGRAFRWEDGVMTDLPDLGAAHTSAADVNERGQVVGWIETDAGSRAVLWQPDGSVVDLGIAGATSRATGINNLGTVAGTTTSPDGVQRAVIWRDGVMTDLGDLGGGESWTPYGGGSINDRGQVTGTSTNARREGKAFRWSDGTMTQLPMPEGLEWSPSFGQTINRSGQVLGTLFDPFGIIVFGATGGSGASSLPDGGLASVFPVDLNDRGEVAGFGVGFDTRVRAFLATEDAIVDLESPNGGISEAKALNRHGQVVGWGDVVEGESLAAHALLWDDGDTIDLGTLDGGDGSIALDINRHGQIVGYSSDEQGIQHAVMWTVDD